MDDLDDREAFLRGIFADPDSDLPRLVFADWLDERGEAAWAELIRLQCQFQFPAKRPADVWHEWFARERELTAAIPMYLPLDRPDGLHPADSELTPHGLSPTPGLCSRSMRGRCQTRVRIHLRRLVNRLSLASLHFA